MNVEETLSVLRSSADLRREFSVRSFHVFGSIVRGQLGPTSDIDILVEFEPDARIGLFEFSRLQRRLSELLGRPVDLVTPDALHKSLRQRILSEAMHAA
jgi:predicted nucleotidyltransferase